jgi:hypothetical protein
MQTYITTIQTALTARASGRIAREVSVRGRGSTTQRLLDLLQVAGAFLVAVKYNGIVTNDLQNWGFTVQAKTAPPAREGEPPAP